MKVLFADATEGFTPTRRSEKPCGGILTSMAIIPKYLASKGMEVTVKSTFSEKCEVDGVKYVPIGEREKLPKWDVLVINRNGINLPIVRYAHSIGSKVVWWLHDIVDMRYLEDKAYDEVDKIVALSHYCKTSYAKFYDIPESRFVVIPNGVEKAVFYPGKFEDRKLRRMILASAPVKGFVPIEATWVNVQRQFKDADLLIYSNQSLHDKQNMGTHDAFLKGMEELGAKVQSPVPQNILADKMRGAGCLLMPNSYPEICSNLLLQAQACGLPVISSNIGSAGEFIKSGETGILTEEYPHDMWLWVKFYVKAVVELFNDQDKQRMISENAPKNVLSWEDVGEKWHEMVQSINL